MQAQRRPIRPARRRARAAGKRHGARQFDPRICRRQLLRCHQRGHQRGSCDAVGDRSAYRDEAEQCEQRQRHPAEPDQQQDPGQRRGAQRFRARHQIAPRNAVGEQAGGDREQDEGQRQRGLQQSGLAFADAEQQHRDDGRRGQRDLLGRLRGEVGPGQAVEGWRQKACFGGSHGLIPWNVDGRHCPASGHRTHPFPDKRSWGMGPSDPVIQRDLPCGNVGQIAVAASERGYALFPWCNV